jgi:hypothetical protein
MEKTLQYPYWLNMSIAGYQVKIEPIDYNKKNSLFIPTTRSGDKLTEDHTYAIIVNSEYVAFL